MIELEGLVEGAKSIFPSTPQAAAVAAGIIGAMLVTIIEWVHEPCAAGLGALTLSKSEKDPHTAANVLYHILQDPGSSFRKIKLNAELPDRLLAWHLRKLEKDGVIDSYNDGVYKRYVASTILAGSDAALKADLDAYRERFKAQLSRAALYRDPTTYTKL